MAGDGVVVIDRVRVNDTVSEVVCVTGFDVGKVDLLIVIVPETDVVIVLETEVVNVLERVK